MNMKLLLSSVTALAALIFSSSSLAVGLGGQLAVGAAVPVGIELKGQTNVGISATTGVENRSEGDTHHPTGTVTTVNGASNVHAEMSGSQTVGAAVRAEEQANTTVKALGKHAATTAGHARTGAHAAVKGAQGRPSASGDVEVQSRTRASMSGS